MAEIIEAAVREANDKIVTDQRLQARHRAQGDAAGGAGAVEGIIAGKPISPIRLKCEVVPAITLGRFQDHHARHAPMAEVTDDARSTRRCNDLPNRTARISPRPDAAPRKGDRVTISVQGTIDGEAFQGGTGDDVPIVHRLGQFHSGLRRPARRHQGRRKPHFRHRRFRRTIARRSRRQDRDLRGDGQVGGERRGTSPSTTRSPTRLGWSCSTSCARAFRDRIGREHAAATRQKLKRALLDELDALPQFEPPPTPGRTGIQQRLDHGRERTSRSRTALSRDEGTTEEKARAEYRAIAERRVRLGLVLAEIGEKNNIKVTDEQLRAR